VQLQARVLEQIDVYSKAPLVLNPDTGEGDYDLRALPPAGRRRTGATHLPFQL
jgi:hypothetical protein